VDLHGGQIGVQSESGKGSMFYVELDVVPNYSFSSNDALEDDIIAGKTLKRSSRSSVNECSFLNTIRILVVDDSAVNRKLLCRMLVPRVGAVSQAENGHEAVAKVRESLNCGTPFDIIFMDAVMPEMCGEDATALIRNMGYSGLIVFITGSAVPEDADRFIAAGANKVVVKPCTLECFINILKTVGKNYRSDFVGENTVSAFDYSI